jgi:hypothetical protein
METFQESIARFLALHSTGALRDLHSAIKQGLAMEDLLPPNATKPHGFRVYADFRWEADAIEAELLERGEPFDVISW